MREQRVPAGRFVPGAVDQAEGGHSWHLYQAAPGLIYTAAHGNRAQRDRGHHLGGPDLPGAPALRQGRRPLRCVRHRRWRQLLRRRLAGRAKPDPLDDLLRRPLGAERARHPQPLVRMRLRAATLAAALLLVALAGCGDDDDSGTQRSQLPPAGGGGTLAYALPSLPGTLDPLAAKDRVAQTVTHQIYEPLLEQLTGPYGQSAAQPGLALSARPSPDRTTWTLTLRLGVRFQDGTPFNAAAVLANSRRWQSDPVGRSLLPDLFAVDAPRPDEIRFLLDNPVPDLLHTLADPRLGIVSPRALKRENDQGGRFLEAPTRSGTGPFQAGPGRLMLSRFSGWWGSPTGLGPALDSVTFVVAPKPSQRLRMLRDGSVQVADPLGRARLRAADADPLLVTVGGPPKGIGMEGSVRGIDSARAVPV